jgi:hypothetical protein
MLYILHQYASGDAYGTVHSRRLDAWGGEEYIGTCRGLGQVYGGRIPKGSSTVM